MHRAILVAGTALMLVSRPAAAQHEHDEQHDHGVHTHRGPGPHFIDAFFTENAYIERKLRPDLFVSTGDEGERYTGQLEVEWAVIPRVSLIVHAPLHHLRPAAGSSQTGIGDIAVGPKLAVINDRTRFILALGADVHLPTGDETRGLGEGHAAAAPFLLAWLPFGPERRLLLQGSGHAEIPIDSDEDTHAEVSTALSWTSPLGVTPLVEGIVEFPVSGDEEASWAIAPGFRWEFAQAWELGAAVRVPVAGPKEEDVRLAFGLIRHFPLPR